MLPIAPDSALRAILVLARTHAGGPTRTDELARQSSAMPSELRETLDTLAEAGIVTRHGAAGYALAVPADRLSLASIVDRFAEAPPDLCPIGAVECDPMRPCAAHEGWPKLVAARRQMLLSTTIADLLAGGRTAERSCGGRSAVASPVRSDTTLALRAAG